LHQKGQERFIKQKAIQMNGLKNECQVYPKVFAELSKLSSVELPMAQAFPIQSFALISDAESAHIMSYSSSGKIAAET